MSKCNMYVPPITCMSLHRIILLAQSQYSDIMIIMSFCTSAETNTKTICLIKVLNWKLELKGKSDKLLKFEN